SMSFASAVLADATSDEVDDLVLEGGLVGSVGAGVYQRARVDVWAWQDDAIRRVDSHPAVSDYRLFTLYDANDLLASGDLAEAVERYKTVVDDEALFDPPEAPELASAVRQFALVRLVWVSLLQGHTDDARRW